MEIDYKETGGSINVAAKNPNVDEMKKDIKADIQSLTTFDIFIKCLKRAENLISFETKTLADDGFSNEHYCDCYRAAIVLAISALDAYIRTILVSEIRNNLVDTKKTLSKELTKYLKDLLNQDDLLDAARNSTLLEKVEKAVKADFETKSFQGVHKIESFLEMVGYKNIFKKVAEESDINESNLKKSLGSFTRRRHEIAHRGDYNLDQNPPKEQVITRSYVSKCISLVKNFAEIVNKIIENK